MPASRNASRILYLLVARTAVSGGLQGSPSAPATFTTVMAARSEPMEHTAETPSCRHASRIRSVSTMLMG